jgi:hypothetical protein
VTVGLRFISFDTPCRTCFRQEPQEILGRTKFCCVEKWFLIPGFALSLFAGKFTKPYMRSPRLRVAIPSRSRCGLHFCTLANRRSA